MDKIYDVIVVGAGHAGCEAALASARMGLNTLMVTINVDAVARMACNPAIGGVAKGQMVTEIDAMGGQMGILTDKTGIQFKMLNASKGPAVWSPRAQCDRGLYSMMMGLALQQQENLDILQSEVSAINVKNRKVCGIKIVTGEDIAAHSVVITTGTFLDGRIYLGKDYFPGGRFNERNASFLSKSLESDCGLQLGRFKTTTVPRINSNSIDYSKMDEQPGDENPLPFSHFTDVPSWRAGLNQVSCYLTHTNAQTHKIVADSLQLSSIDIGESNSKSPRYCPAIEEKVERYPQKNSHQVFVEPEGRLTNEVYLNGLFTGIPFDVQQKMINSIAGLEHAKVIRYGYAIEYDYSSPLQIKKNLETKSVRGLFLAGQINGTTGYEEAASQGFVAGVNAALYVRGEEPFILQRYESYIGILIDDITSKGMDEPYRMFTSRAEYRLSIRNDNADLRLMEKGYKLGLINDAQMKKFEVYKKAIRILEEGSDEPLPTPAELAPWTMQKVEQEYRICKKYKGYIQIQDKLLNKVNKYSDRHIPRGFDYDKLPSLSAETRERLKFHLPETISEMIKLPSIRPSDIAIVAIALDKIRDAKILAKKIEENEEQRLLHQQDIEYEKIDESAEDLEVAQEIETENEKE
ncbi:MAG: tRNA uridine-5-carboxymethylaminomethyl(34) synthesis enzyme MnmG [Elusimicrobiota bacterium]|jgi:tRNA uridine 5-carboxymethylaminomethyl modification enzyme|nr:tRNA uridine-5-carboxymethylaminomethyl(34) synthesis enzyme MnmG [Elusimicrobiota bacterium]